jgi:hypothetical protein
MGTDLFRRFSSRAVMIPFMPAIQYDKNVRLEIYKKLAKIVQDQERRKSQRIVKGIRGSARTCHFHFLVAVLAAAPALLTASL